MLPRTPLIPLGPGPLETRIQARRERQSLQAARLPNWMGISGFVDIHCHVAPGLDDGPAILEQASELIWAAYRAGTLAMVATPHRSLRYNWSSQARGNGLRQLRARMPEGFALFAGCELELSDEAWRSFELHPRRYCLNQSRYVLVELPRAGAARTFDVMVRKLRRRGFVPILAHAEQCRSVGDAGSRLAQWVREGCLLQITADAVSGRRGRQSQSAAVELVRAGLAHFAASDAHNAFERGPNLQPAYRVVCEIAGIAQAARLFAYNPLRVLRDEPLEASLAAAR